MKTLESTRARRRRAPLLPLAALSTLTVGLGFSSPVARADALTQEMTNIRAGLTVPLPDWRFQKSEADGPERPDYDDSAWQVVHPGFQWPGENSRSWFRARLTIPETVGGLKTAGQPIRLRVGMDDDGEIYVNGKLAQKFHWDDGDALLTDSAVPGQTLVIAVRGINTIGSGQLHFARLEYGALDPVQPAFDTFVRDANFAGDIAGSLSASEQSKVTDIRTRAEAQVGVAALRGGNLSAFGTSLAKAQGILQEMTPLTNRYHLYYVGHAHIDMNWLWTWPETIDVCHRTWDSAMKLMGQFPDFGFVQSQPGAYVPIERQFPDEFTRMQAAARRGQWDPVGGMWDESDTNMPSGEALARSLFLGQRYFQAKFGRYARTGWLPDSFGHSWQVPQLLQGAGITSFYHMRCGDGVRFSWWESPDGSRVLKANTDSYDEPMAPDQLARPFQNARRYGVSDALVVFGVGDHGGGPTREQILEGKKYQADPISPRVTFVTADTFFDRLRADIAASPKSAVPVIRHDLQYTFEGCYTTHADLKKAVRSSENALYEGEALSSMAASLPRGGTRYPVSGFTEAWKPTTFAQFHDIMCGTAIHSTYDWMFQQLAPAIAFEHAQTAKAASTLTAAVDTQTGSHPGETPVVVWNVLSFARDDAVRVSLSTAEAARFRSARDAATGKRLPVQDMGGGTLVFVAQGVPGLGSRTYFLSSLPPTVRPNAAAQSGANSYALENGAVRLTVDRRTGLLTELRDRQTGVSLLAPGRSGNLLQLLEDKGNAWVINLTGKVQNLNTPDAHVSLVQNGPVCKVVRVSRRIGAASSVTQDIILWSGLKRVDLPTTVEWHEHDQMLKAAFPLAMQHPAARVGIPYGSIARPTNGQENPGQKWMDVSETRPAATPSSPAVSSAVPLNLAALFNHASTGDFDGQGRGYVAADLASLPHDSAGVYRLGAAGIPFILRLPSSADQKDNVVTAGQSLTVPAAAAARTANSVLFLLGAGAPGAQGGVVTLVGASGKRYTQTVSLGDWVTGGEGNDQGAALRSRTGAGGQGTEAVRPHLWIASTPLPDGDPVRQIVLPDNPNMHVFGAALGAAASPAAPIWGLTVLNDCKYGSDTNGGVFRLTLLRSTSSPDPHPDQGTERFTYSLLPHSGGPRIGGHAEQAGLALNIPLRAVVASRHPGTASAPPFTLTDTTSGGGDLVAGALKHAEDAPGFILRLYETQGRNTTAFLRFPRPVKVVETDLLERPAVRRRITLAGNEARFPVGHDQIVTLHITGLPDAGITRPAASSLR